MMSGDAFISLARIVWGIGGLVGIVSMAFDPNYGRHIRKRLREDYGTECCRLLRRDFETEENPEARDKELTS